MSQEIIRDTTNPLNRLIDNLPGMAYRALADAHRTMKFVSQGCLQLTGYPAEALVENSQIAYGDLVYEADRQLMFQEIEAAIEEKRPYRIIYRLVSTKDGQIQWVLEKGTPFFHEDGSVDVVEGFITDHTQRMLLFHQLEQRVFDRTRKLTALYDILEVAADLGDLDTTIARTLDRVLKAIKGNVGAIHLLNDSETELILAAQLGMAPDVLAAIQVKKLAESELFSWIVAYKRPLIIPSLSQDKRTIELAGDETLDVYIGVPIMAHEKVLGILTVLSDDMSGYSGKEELELLISVGEQIGVVVENARLRQKSEQLVLLEERNRLARDLHDSVTQALYSVSLFAEAGRTLAHAGDLEKASRYFTDVLDTGQQALKEMRLLLYKLRPAHLEDEGLVAALQHRLRAVENRAGVKTEMVVQGNIDLSNDLEEALFYIAQEALNNSIKHAAATKLNICLIQTEESVVMDIIDNGCGFDFDSSLAGGGLGLSNMMERCHRLKGLFAIETSNGAGTKISVKFLV